MCAREGEAVWQRQQMPLENFKKLLPYLAEVETVVLEGWGESLLHPDLTEIVHLVKREGPKVGFVTSGFGLRRERVRELIKAGIDFMGFSLAGTTPAIHDAIRIHSHLSDVLDVIRLVNEEKTILGLDRPRLHIVYLMLKDNIGEVPSLPALAGEVGIEEVLLINSCHIVTPWQESQRVFARKGETEDYEAIIRQAQERARARGIRMKRSALCIAEAAVCSENPLKNLYISAEGEVAPCVYAHPPLSSPFRRRFCGEDVPVGKVSFGNVFHEPFLQIWGSADYKVFRDRFIRRELAYKAFFRSLLDGSVKDPQHGFALPAPLEPCQSCHKILGV
jgi:MoaA/NifB/PqqE/SkfB family radical SAM enzyme